jgi:thioredoxin-like negative regulator of GroEL
LGSTLRVLGRHAQAYEVLSSAVEAYPDEPVLKAFLAMALHNVGRGQAAVELLLGVVADTSADREVRAYRRAIELYAQDLDRTWPLRRRRQSGETAVTSISSLARSSISATT